MKKRPAEVRGDWFYLKAYRRLSTTRGFLGNQMLPIPWHRVDDYGRRYRLGPMVHEFFVDVVMLLDQSHRQSVEDQGQELQKRRAKEERRAQQATGMAQPEGEGRSW